MQLHHFERRIKGPSWLACLRPHSMYYSEGIGRNSDERSPADKFFLRALTQLSSIFLALSLQPIHRCMGFINSLLKPFTPHYTFDSHYIIIYRIGDFQQSCSCFRAIGSFYLQLNQYCFLSIFHALEWLPYSLYDRIIPGRYLLSWPCQTSRSTKQILAARTCLVKFSFEYKDITCWHFKVALQW